MLHSLTRLTCCLTLRGSVVVFVGKSSQMARLSTRLGLSSVVGIELAEVVVPTINVDLLAFGSKAQGVEAQNLTGTQDTAALAYVCPYGKVWVVKQVFRGLTAARGVVVVEIKGVRVYLHNGTAQYSGGGGLILGPGDLIAWWNTGNVGDTSIPCQVAYTQEDNYLNMEE